MGIAAGIASFAAGVYGANKKAESARAAGRAAQGAAYVPPIDSYRDKGYEERRLKQNELYGNVEAGSDFRQGQVELSELLAEKARGEGNSLASNVLQQGIEGAQSAALGSASAQAGAAGGLGLRNLLGAQGQLSLQGANQASQIGLKEQLAAQGQLGALQAQGRAGDQAQNSQLLSILQTQGSEDNANRQALINRENLIQKGKSEAATGKASALHQVGSAQQGLYNTIGTGLANVGTTFSKQLGKIDEDVFGFSVPKKEKS